MTVFFTAVLDRYQWITASGRARSGVHTDNLDRRWLNSAHAGMQVIKIWYEKGAVIESLD